jgi:putative membrane protein
VCIVPRWLPSTSLANLLEGVDPWRFQAHVEVWLLMIAIIGSYVYAIKVIGPRVVTNGPVVTRRQIQSFTAGALIMWIASDWPMHDIAEEYLYSVHMLQHMMLSYFVPPLMLLATPKWLFDAVFGSGRGYRAIKFLSRAPVAGLLFNVMVMVAHIPDVVNRSVSNGPLHYSLHILLIVTSLLMWMPVCGPEKPFRLQYGGMMIFLFLMSVIPTVPAAWLTFAEGSVYKHYDIPVRVWGLSVTTDQQLAGAVMKSAGSLFLWSIIVVIFFRRFIGRFFAEATYSKESTEV